MSEQQPWPRLDAASLEEKSVRLMFEQAQKALEPQILGIEQVFQRLGAVLAQSIVLGVAAATASSVSGGITAERAGLSTALPWLPWPFAAAAVVFFLASLAAAIGMNAVNLAGPGPRAHELYDHEALTAPYTEVLLYTSRYAHAALLANEPVVDRVSRRLAAATALLVTAPLAGVVTVVIWFLSQRST